MTDITVIRGAGDRPGDDIFSPILCTDAAAIIRGRAEIDAGTQAAEVRLEARYLPDAIPGKLVEIRSKFRLPWRGKITSVRHYSSSPGKVRTELIIWRPRT